MRVGLPVGVVQSAIDETITGVWTFANALGILTDVIGERTPGAGVTIDGLLVRDGGIPEAVVTAHEAALVIAGSQIPSLPEALVTAHEAALSILESQIVDGSLLARLAAVEAITGLWSFEHASGLLTDDINERTVDAGVVVDGLLLVDAGLLSRALALNTTPFVRIRVSGDSVDRFNLDADGEHRWGPGDAVADVTLGRTATGELTLGGAFNIADELDLAGDLELSERNMTLSGNATDDDVATGTVTVQRLDPNATAFVTGFAGGRPGRLMMIYNRTVSSLTVQHENAGSVAANRVRGIGAANFLIRANAGVTLWYDSTLSRWIVMSVAA